MSRYLPFAVGILLIVGLTYLEGRMTDRLSPSNISAEQQAELFAKVPMKVGDWQGENKFVDEKIKETAGAIGAVSRTYRNSRTGEVVDLWLIVGHARDISYHTPDICYRGSGFDARAPENSVYTMTTGDPDQSAPFLTNTFVKNDDLTGQQLVRVFWSWYNPQEPENNGKVVWDAPTTNPRWHFGNTRALFKMYFTSLMRDSKETANESACIRFARDFLPEVNKALETVPNEPNGEGADKSAAEPKADSAKSGSEPATADKKAADSKTEKELFGTEKPTTSGKTAP